MLVSHIVNSFESISFVMEMYEFPGGTVNVNAGPANQLRDSREGIRPDPEWTETLTPGSISATCLYRAKYTD
jgi:hypothetical protein